MKTKYRRSPRRRGFRARLKRIGGGVTTNPVTAGIVGGMTWAAGDQLFHSGKGRARFIYRFGRKALRRALR